jgi:hypothetical protein
MAMEIYGVGKQLPSGVSICTVNNGSVTVGKECLCHRVCFCTVCTTINGSRAQCTCTIINGVNMNGSERSFVIGACMITAGSNTSEKRRCCWVTMIIKGSEQRMAASLCLINGSRKIGQCCRWHSMFLYDNQWQ